MGWITPVITWVAGNGIGFSDLNRIEGDLKYLREENKTINGTNTFTGNITQTSGVTSLKATTIDGITLTTIGSVYQAGSLGYTDANQGFLYRPPQAGAANAHNFQSFAGVSLLQIGESGRVWFGGTDNEADLLQVGVGLNISAGIGFGKLGYNGTDSDQFSISHYDNNNSVDYALIASSTNTFLNSKATVYIRNSDATTAQFSSSAISLLKPVTVTGALTATGKIQSGLSTVIEDWTTSNTVARYGHKDFNLNGGYGYIQNSAGQFNIEGAVNQNCSIGVDGGSQLNFIGLSINVLGNINPTTTPTSGTWGINLTNFVIPRGLYNIKMALTAGVQSIKQNGVIIMDFAGTGALLSDGSNTTVTTDGTATIQFWKF
jgi:hypothetical protein